MKRCSGEYSAGVYIETVMGNVKPTSILAFSFL